MRGALHRSNILMRQITKREQRKQGGKFPNMETPAVPSIWILRLTIAHIIVKSQTEEDFF